MSDLIDRQELLRQIDIDADGEPGYYGDTWKFIDTIKSMPSAELGTNLAEVGTDCISRQAAIDTVVFECGEWMGLASEISKQLRQLPPTEPKRIRGKWVGADTQCGIACSVCGVAVDDFCHSADYIDLDYEPNFCPNCGADMRGEQNG